MPLDLSAVDRIAWAQAPSAPAQPDEEHTGLLPYLAMAGGQGADLATTLMALRDPRLREGNPMFGNHPAAIIGTKLAVPLAMAMAMRGLDKSDHDTASKLIGYLMGVGGAIPAALNVHTMHSLK